MIRSLEQQQIQTDACVPLAAGFPVLASGVSISSLNAWPSLTTL